MTPAVTSSTLAMPVIFAPPVKENVAAADAVSVDLTAGALEFKLGRQCQEYIDVLDKIMAANIKSQNARNDKVKLLNALLNELGRLQASSESFSEKSLDKVTDMSAPDSPQHQENIKKAQEELDRLVASATDTERSTCQKVLDWELSGWRGTEFKSEYYSMLTYMNVDYMEAQEDGTILFMGREKTSGVVIYRIRTPSNSNFYPSWSTDQIKAAYRNKKSAIADAKKRFDPIISGKTTVGELLTLYIYKDGKNLPTSKEELKISSERISNMISDIENTQTMKSADNNKVLNGRNEGYSRISTGVDDYVRKLQELVQAFA
jgi:hypothetical protein